MTDHSDFAPDYVQARRRFLQSAREYEGVIHHYSQSGQGPRGEPLVTDVARFGRPDAERWLVLQSGTHGVEGLCGSGCQLGWLRTRAQARPDDVSVLVVHAINPHGFAWEQRETAEGVDLNRNFIDHDAPRPSNLGYEALADAFGCPQLEGPLREQADRVIDEYEATHGESELLAALAMGQYTHPGGLYFGGHALTEAGQTFGIILAEHVADAKRVGVIDLHSGLGPYGEGLVITLDPPGSAALARVRQWYGEDVFAPFDDPDSLVPEVRGHLIGASARLLPQAEVTAIALEFGTFSTRNDTEVYRAMRWLMAQQPGSVQAEQEAEIRAKFRRHFYPDDEKWRAAIWDRAQAVIEQALVGLKA
ncbi:MAG: DUF2817 domain-containing protein [Myxococcota bacterium]